MPPHFSLESLLLIILQLEKGQALQLGFTFQSCTWEFDLAQCAERSSNEIQVCIEVWMMNPLRGWRMFWSGALVCSLTKTYSLSSPPTCLPHPEHDLLLSWLFSTHGFALMFHSWNSVKLAFLSPEACTSVIRWRQALDLPQHFRLGCTSLTSVSPVPQQRLLNANENIHFEPKAMFCALTAKGGST